MSDTQFYTRELFYLPIIKYLKLFIGGMQGARGGFFLLYIATPENP